MVKSYFKNLITILILFPLFLSGQERSWVRINQLGYLPNSVKVAVFISKGHTSIQSFTLHDAVTGKEVFQGKTKPCDPGNWGMNSAYRLDFSSYENTGEFFIEAENTKSYNFRINPEVYAGTADFILNYMRQQRCGFNPYFNDSCHTHDGIIVDHPSRSGEFIDVTGGWHDASDYLQYTTTSANAVYQMLFAYQKNPEIFEDQFNSSGLKGANQIPDILDEIRWGLEWLLKMNPSYGEMFNQIADDRDHVGFRLPTTDTASYGLGKYRPVYFVTGKPQGLGKYKNQSDGVASVAGKFASAFALGAQIFKNSEPEFSVLLEKKAIEAYKFGLTDPGVSQTACNVSPYFYEEANYTDDMELAACELFRLTGNKKYWKAGIKWGRLEPITPWIEKGEARHYQYYPFVNLGHYILGNYEPGEVKSEFQKNYRNGLQILLEQGKNDPFLNGLPFIWCSNNLVAAALTQARLYAEISGSIEFAEMEAALRDWLFGNNPWGTAMICGLPGVHDSPKTPHSSLTVYLNEPTYGGLVDGPVYRSVYESLIGVILKDGDEYAAFQSGKAVYHDDTGDYSTNEPTMDGTASLSFYLAALEAEGRKQKD